MVFKRPTDLEGQTRAQLIMARRTSLHSKAEYICADLSLDQNFPLQSCGGPYIKRDRAPIGAWLDALDSRAPKNVVVVAMANKLARIAWAVLSSGNDYRPVPA